MHRRKGRIAQQRYLMLPPLPLLLLLLLLLRP
jgi:hypothetical protein